VIGCRKRAANPPASIHEPDHDATVGMLPKQVGLAITVEVALADNPPVHVAGSIRFEET